MIIQCLFMVFESIYLIKEGNMKTHNMYLAALLILTTQTAMAKLEVHEWGTFTSLVGSNGLTQNGMYHEDEKLPDFVHGFGETVSTPAPEQPRRDCPRNSKSCIGMETITANFISQKMETPVLYFYTDRTQDVEVNVKFPMGAVTETYPGPVATYPTPNDAPVLKNGDTTFRVQVSTEKSANIPAVDPTNIYSHARNVNSNIVRSGNETEKFIFYRGLGSYQPRLQIISVAGSLGLKAPKEFYPVATFLVNVDDGGYAQMINVGHVGASSYKFIDENTIYELRTRCCFKTPDILRGDSVRKALHDSLHLAGLFHDEANAMIDTWEQGYFKVPGLRVLYILSREEVEEVLPLTMSPRPDSLQRAFVGRVEVLLANDEQKILGDVIRLKEQFDVTTLGRFAEPKLRRVYEIFKQSSGTDERMERAFKELISKAAAQ
jgi:hypothetical protein